MSNITISDASALPLAGVRVKNTFLEVVDQQCNFPNMKRRGSAPGRILPDISEAYPSYDSEGPTFFSEGAYGFAAFSSEGVDSLIDGLTDDSSDEDGGASSKAADDSGASTSGSAGVDTSAARSSGADAKGGPEIQGTNGNHAGIGGEGPEVHGEGAEPAGSGAGGGGPEAGGAGGRGGPAPGGAGAEGEPAAQGAPRGRRRPRGGKRPCKSKRERCTHFLEFVQRSFEANPDLDLEQIEMPRFVNSEWLRRRAHLGIRGRQGGAPAGGAAPGGPP